MDIAIITTISIIGIAILQSLAVSLGVGTSTVAIVNFFLAIDDGKIDSTERRMMRAVYILLRIAMVVILLATGALTAIQYHNYGAAYFIPFVISLWIVIGVLYLNAILMTMKVMPSTIGPALQAASWYSLGLLLTFLSLGLYNYPLKTFTIAYIVIIVFTVGVVNVIMMIQERRAQQRAVNTPVPTPTASTNTATQSTTGDSMNVSTDTTTNKNESN